MKNLNDMIAELIDIRDNLPEGVDASDVEVRLAQQPNYPLQAPVGDIVSSADDDEEDREEGEPVVVWIGERSSAGLDSPYLPGLASRLLGWR